MYFAYEFGRRESEAIGKSSNPERGESILKRKFLRTSDSIRTGTWIQLLFNRYLISLLNTRFPATFSERTKPWIFNSEYSEHFKFLKETRIITENMLLYSMERTNVENKTLN